MILHWLPVMLTQIESERRDDRKQDNTDQNSFFFFLHHWFPETGIDFRRLSSSHNTRPHPPT